jgi:hypothetical protein
MNVTLAIVIARYNEDVEWTKQFPNVIIYNKGNPLNNGFNEIMLDNVGRESHTYYKYICDNYDNLPDYVIFLQGNPFDHSPNIISNLNNYFNLKNFVDFEFLSERILDCNLSSCIYHEGLPLIRLYEEIFNIKKMNMDFKFGCGAQFIVSKQNILKRSKCFYLKLISLLDYDICPIEGYVMERFQKLIFE